ncbi:hypothetical protein MHB40_20195 [Lysinibacillus sp. FSL K6-0057]|uniref:hypothetical protein n=1 Tax=Lysinibacillus sp. FSL K6-0057 TaxID=2921411 RepID=UPI003159E4F6
MGYKEILILHYFNNVKASYSYDEILKIFGLQTEQLDNILSNLLKDGLIELENYFKLTKIGVQILKELNLYRKEYDDVGEENLFVNEPLRFDEIYIPKRFDKKFKEDII